MKEWNRDTNRDTQDGEETSAFILIKSYKR